MSNIVDPEEVLDLVDRDDRVIGTIKREDVPALSADGNAGMVRAASCFIMNGKGQIWVPRRVSTKRVAPNGFDFSVSEHVGAGETYAHASKRGFAEEIGLTVTDSALNYIGKVDMRVVALPYFEAIYTFYNENVAHYNRNDFASYEWLSPEEILARLNDHEAAKPSLRPAIELLISKRK